MDEMCVGKWDGTGRDRECGGVFKHAMFYSIMLLLGGLKFWVSAITP